MNPAHASKRLLWFVPKWPLPMQDGARVANVNLMKGLSGLGVTIDLIALAGEDEKCDVEELRGTCGISDCFVVRRKGNGGRFGLRGMIQVLRTFLSRPGLAVTLMPYAARGVRQEISGILARGPRGGGQWSDVVYDGLHPAAHASRSGIYRRPADAPRVIYRAHNVESEIWKRKAAQTRFYPLRLFLHLQTFLMKRFEDSLVNDANSVLTVSEVDLDLFRKDCPALSGETVPIGYDFGEISAVPKNQERSLFLARLDWPPNRDGLIWLLENVWTEARRRRPTLELWIAGSGDSEWLKARLPIPGVKFLGRVDRVEDIYRDCLLSLVPVFYGSGTRVKAIEASRYGSACLSTGVGVEGLGLEAGKTYFQAETAAEWIEILARWDFGQMNLVGQHAHDLLKRSYHLPVAARKFLDAVSN